MTTQTKALKMAEPSMWRIRGQLRHEGITYGPGEPIPSMTLSDAERYESLGRLVRLAADGSEITQGRPQRSAPPNATAYLYARDLEVMRAIVDHHPSKQTILEIRTLAKVNGRSQTLLFALDAIIAYGEERG
ncbi:MAG TPA: hypothetical protein VLA89_13525 [Gemmatimonadales bacterium]|nr:hypothetical protein [Gemmatimonadales bacterium]